jgi:hypothetical protein
MLCKDNLKLIFSHLSAKDIISCSLVNRKWYETTNDNRLWFRLFCVEANKFQWTNIIYDDKINYKLYFLSLFHQRYTFVSFDFYKSLFDFINKNDSKISKICATILVVAPALILFMPFIFAIEMKSLLRHLFRKYEFCGCDGCISKIYDKRKHIIHHKL